MKKGLTHPPYQGAFRTNILTKKEFMKTTFLKISLSILLLAIMGAGCDKDNDSNFEKYPIGIIKELPVLYGGCNLKDGETAIIRDQVALEKVFIKDLINQNATLKDIDFAKYDVLVGCSTFTRGIAKLEHNLTQTGANIWLYKLTVIYDLTYPAGKFYYGIAVNKLPAGASVSFNVLRINE
jgi:hypothetical protein